MIWDHKFSSKTISVKSIPSYFFQIFRQNQSSCKITALECIIRNYFQICTQFQGSIKTCTIIKCVFPNLSYTVRNYQISTKAFTPIKCVFPNLCQIVPETQSSFTALKSTAVLETVFPDFFQILRQGCTFQCRASRKCIIPNFCNSFRNCNFLNQSIIFKNFTSYFFYLVWNYHFFI